MNSRPLVPVSSDPDAPAVLSPSMLLTQKKVTLISTTSPLSTGKKFKALLMLSGRGGNKNTWRLQVGDVVLLRDSQARRTEWPTGHIVKTVLSQDKRVRKVEVKVVKQGTPKVYLRPISEVILLFPKECVVV